MDINEAHYNMEHMSEVALRQYLNHHNIKATGTLQNCVSCMKWKAQNKPVKKCSNSSYQITKDNCSDDYYSLKIVIIYSNIFVDAFSPFKILRLSGICFRLFI
jgi:hypothetical protein